MRWPILLLLSGCALTAEELRQGGVVLEFVTNAAPRATAECVAKNGSNRPEAFAQVREAATVGGPIEVLVYAPSPVSAPATMLYAIARVEAQGSGSRVTIRAQPMLKEEAPAGLGPRHEVRSRTHHFEYERYIRPLPTGC